MLGPLEVDELCHVENHKEEKFIHARIDQILDYEVFDSVSHGGWE